MNCKHCNRHFKYAAALQRHEQLHLTAENYLHLIARALDRPATHRAGLEAQARVMYHRLPPSERALADAAFACERR